MEKRAAENSKANGTGEEGKGKEAEKEEYDPLQVEEKEEQKEGKKEEKGASQDEYDPLQDEDMEEDSISSSLPPSHPPPSERVGSEFERPIKRQKQEE